MSVATRTEEQTPEAARTTASAPPRPLEIVFALRTLPAMRCFQSSLELLVQRGHHVRLALEGLESFDSRPAERSWLERMLQKPNFVWDCTRHLRDGPWRKRAVGLGNALEYVNCLGPAYAGRPRYVKKALHRSPRPFVVGLAALPLVRTQRG